MPKRRFSIISLLILVSLVPGACLPRPALPQTGEITQTPVAINTPEAPNADRSTFATATVQGLAARPAVLRVAMESFPDMMDPQKSSVVNEIAHIQMIYEGLTRLNEKLETVPGAAERWEYNADASEITFTLRKGLAYGDGTVLNAKRYEYSILRAIDPETAGDYAQIMDDIAGASEWRHADPKDPSYDREALKAGVKVQALDSNGQPCTDYQQVGCQVLKIGLAHPVPYFHTLMSLWVAYPAKEENITAGGENWWNFAQYQVGNGPFILQRLEPFEQASFIPNPHYWRGQPTYDLEYSYVGNSPLFFEAYKNNEFDMISLTPEHLLEVQSDPALSRELHSYPGSCTIAVMFNQLKEPFNDPKVRQAFAYALDREAWARDVVKGTLTPTLTWIPPGYPAYQEGETRWGFDAVKARQALAESSYGSAEALPEIVVTFGDMPGARPRWEWLAAGWKEVLRVEIRLDPIEPAALRALMKDVKTAPQIFFNGWCADYPDPQNWLSMYWKTGAFASATGFSNPKMDSLMDAADIEVDPAKRMALYRQAQDILVENAPAAFLGNNVNSFMVKPWVKGAVPTPQDTIWMGMMDPLAISIDMSLRP